MAKRAVIVVDLQNDYFPGGKFPLVGIDEAAARAARVVAAARTRGEPVLHVRHESRPAGAPFFVPGSAGAEIHPSVHPAEGEAVIVKNFPNSFRETGLKGEIDAQGVTELVVVGAMSHMCIDATTRAAIDLGYRVSVVQDACATRDLEFDGLLVPAAQVHAAFMAALAAGYASVIATGAYLDP